MKRTRQILALILALTLCAGVFAGCQGNPEPTTEPQQTETTQPAGLEATLIQGVFMSSGDPSHVSIIRFKEDGTFYAQGLTQQRAYMGTWKVVEDVTIDYLVTGSGGSVSTEREPEFVETPATVGVALYEMDGVTPFSIRGYEAVNNVPEMNTDVPDNILPYAENALHAVLIDGYSRTLKHDPDNSFSEEDEIKNLLYCFMPESLPDWAVEDGYTLQELTMKLYHNCYEDMATDLYLQAGDYASIDGNVYTFDNGAVVTVAEDGKTAVYVNGDMEIPLIEWYEESSGEVEELLKLSTTMNVGIDIEFFMTFYSNAKVTLTAEAMGTTIEHSADFMLDTSAGLPNVVFSNATAGEFTFGWGESGTVVFTWNGDVSEKLTGQTIEFVTASSDLGAIQNAKPSVVSLMVLESTAALGNVEAACTLEFSSDNTVCMTVSVMGTEMSYTGNWTLDMAAPAVVFENASAGEFTFGWGNSGSVVFTWSGDLSERMTGQTIEFTTASSDLAKLMQ